MAWYSADQGTYCVNLDASACLYANDNGDGTWSVIASAGGRLFLLDSNSTYTSQQAALTAAQTLVSAQKLA